MPASAAHTNLRRWWLPGLGAIAAFAAGIALELPALFALPFVAVVVPRIVQVEVKHLFFLLLFFIPLSTELEVGGSLSTDVPDEPVMLLLTGALLGYFLLHPRRFPAAAARSSVVALLVLQLAWIFLTVIFSHNTVVSLKYLLAKTWYLVPFILGTLVFLQRREDFIKAGLLLVAGLSIPVVASLVQHAPHGFSFESVNDTLHPFFRNHVSYSAMIAFLLPILFAGQHLSTGRTRKLFILLIILFTAALFFAYSRGAWLAVIAGVFTWWAVRRRQLLNLLALSVILAVIGVTWLIRDDNFMRFAPDFNKTYFRTDFSEHMAATYELKDISTMERFYRWVAGVRMVKEEPVTGFGPNTFYYHYKHYAVAAFKTWVSENKERSTVHNYFLLLAIEQGFPGLVLFVALLFLLFRLALRAYHRLTDPFDQALAMLCAVILSMIVVLNLLSDLIETDKVGGLFFLVTGVLVYLENRMREKQGLKE
ncbi:MAG TPA: O-antigen ligase family protein [Lacibacter sp.]|nr:O-antigen ligase family protein [Lacibacter sp.]HMO88391.1 O-antigen ligase family protein [Lacibacter sp.]